MLSMAKKSDKPIDPHKGRQINFRVYDQRLLDAIELYAKRSRRERNMAITLLVEAALQQEGLWPPPADPEG